MSYLDPQLNIIVYSTIDIYMAAINKAKVANQV